ncbi:MAG: amidohydrolase family protein [SAR202 cluster bacterium]|nr:amidohydrolase family protein [SAR202 cluster bacterium]
MPTSSVFKARRIARADLTGWLSDHAVIVTDGRIEAVLPAAKLPSDVAKTRQVFDLGDVSLLPGLVDVHSHMHCSATADSYHLVTTESVSQLLLRASGNVRKVLLSGVTTLRDLGSRNEVAFPLRDAVRSGVVPGPRLLLAGTPITTTAGHCYMFGTEADTVEQVITAVRHQKKLGADCIKIMATGGMFTPTANPRSVQYPASTLKAATQEAERLGMQIAAHTLSSQGVRNCAEAGIHHLIHARWLHHDARKGLDYDPAVSERLAKNGQVVDVTFGHMLIGAEREKAGGEPHKLHWSVAVTPVTNEDHIKVTRDMREKGVKFITGLDMGMSTAPFDHSAYNAKSFVEYLDYSTWEAIRASTVDSARALGLGDVTGALRPGLSADLMSVRGDPAQDITALLNAVDVVLEGKPVKLGGRPLV